MTNETKGSAAFAVIAKGRQQAVADELSVHMGKTIMQGVVSRYARGRASPRADMMLAVQSAYGIPMQLWGMPLDVEAAA